MKKILSILLALTILFIFASCGQDISIDVPQYTNEDLVLKTDADTTKDDPTVTDSNELQIDENGSYDSKDEVALYIHTYGHLPPNYITKKEAQALGWTGGSLDEFAPGKCIGGTRFGNYEGLLPEADGRKYSECDIDTIGKKSRGSKRIVYSNDGLIYYTDDHYETFVLLYGDESK